MKKFLKITVLAIIVMLFGIVSVYAEDLTVLLQANKTEAKVGDEITVDLVVKNQTGVEGFNSVLTYNKSVLSLKKIEPADDFSDLSGENTATGQYNLSFVYNGNEELTDTTIAILKFQVLSSATVGDTINISLSSVEVNDSADAWLNLNENNNPKATITVVNDQQTEPGTQTSTEKTLTGIKVTKAPTKTEYNEEESFDKTGMVVKAEYSDETSKEITDYTIENGSKLSKGQKSVKISYTEGNVTKTTTQAITVIEKIADNDIKKDDNSKTDKNVPYTGAESITGVIVVIAIIGIVSFIRYNSYKRI